MSGMRVLRRGLAMLLATLLGLCLAYLFAAFVLTMIPRRALPHGIDDFRYFACDNGVHVDILLPVVGGGRDWRSFFPPADFAGDVAGASHIGFGWGARDFFATTPHWRDMRPWPILKALFWLDESVLHVSYHGNPAGAAGCRALVADAAGRERLFAFIDATLGGAARRVDLPGYGPNDAFYAAVGRYSLFRTCNIWSADALHQAGAPTGLWSPFSFQVMDRLSQDAPG
ncbi:uncharacterized protein (TIGR02117 family) [Dongia mobilis]|uniref:Uncharacterized protein (TIGR02117 family) n=2 Tax=Dongia mobilis TaxID=578943 RepID=A0A4R6WVR9_9PROT|nr:uncharacterized protein (TIGR02117 family) [Dongia mobilis]